MCRAGALVSRPTALASCPHHSRFHHTRGISLHPILFPSSPWPVPIWRVALDHENRKTPISKPAANAQRPNVQAETRRTRLRRSCGISWDRSIIDSRVPFAAIAGAILYGRTPSRRPGHAFKLPPNSGPPSVRRPTLVLRCSLAWFAFSSGLFQSVPQNKYRPYSTLSVPS